MPRRSDRSARADGAATGLPVIDGYDHLEPIGRGGFSFVFSARQRDFNRRVAIKVLSFGLADERERRSFERECRAMGLVSQHPHIVTVFNSAFTATKQPCIVMELYSGGTMTDRQRREGELSVATVLDVGVKIAGALQTAHDRGLLHRDIKPQNLFISEFGEPALGDFGISTLDDERSISGSGGLTVHYAPPEVLEGAEASSISDVYSFAATLYTLLEGSRPFAAGPDRRQSVGELARRIMLEDPPRPSRRDVPRSLADLLVRTMAKDPSVRPASAAAFGQALQRIQGELGLPVTSLPLAGPVPDLPSNPPRVAASPPWPATGPAADLAPPAPSAGPTSLDAPVDGEPAPAAPAAPAVHVRFPDQADDDEGHTVTVGRARVAPTAPAPAPDRESSGGPSTKRAVIGTAVAVVALLAVAGALLVFGGGGGGGDEPGPTTTGTGPGPSDVGPTIGLLPPQGVTAALGEDGTSIIVSWNPPDDPERIALYKIERLDAVGGVTDTPNGTTYTMTIEIPDGVPPNLCVRVYAIGPDGNMSDPSALGCV